MVVDQRALRLGTLTLLACVVGAWGERRGGSNIAYRRALVGVRYALESDIGLRLPVEMRERYRDRHGSRVEGIATYTNFRRFQVQVEESAPFRD